MRWRKSRSGESPRPLDYPGFRFEMGRPGRELFEVGIQVAMAITILRSTHSRIAHAARCNSVGSMAMERTSSGPLSQGCNHKGIKSVISRARSLNTIFRFSNKPRVPSPSQSDDSHLFVPGLWRGRSWCFRATFWAFVCLDLLAIGIWAGG
ncbi:uncharacterized protein F5Z01DRAFT_338285 [Emericellopsis atlantica]|uniref:Uncharacterized protein n=1 Tax=Emericellopsis atlantica TaxID=2614577 RepID=A0A9P7ZFF6_9HYPO|nr:uncharacterized protein F5Z01DRAFT_338285 [Emericellopsis atlantica]KAG9250946.1 hypothetical protein F5Z01DRAFT_338285 [Emericellopsis atlantica]